MLRVLLTVDTEFWPSTPDWSNLDYKAGIAQDIQGATQNGNFGLCFQIETLNKHNLKAVFFVESLSANVVGLDPLKKIIKFIQGNKQEVQMHLHSEWLKSMKESPVQGRTGQNLKNFSENDQRILIAVGLRNLKDAGSQNVCAFRAGNYGADNHTLRALEMNGIRYDSSYNACYLESHCGIRTPKTLLQPTEMMGVCEIPISFFKERYGHHRHAQISACSSEEMENAMVGAWRNGWSTFVIVSHSFELLKNRKRSGKPVLPDRVVINRFNRLCKFLDGNRDKFQTCGFSDLDLSDHDYDRKNSVLAVPFYCTTIRFAEQAMRRIF